MKWDDEVWASDARARKKFQNVVIINRPASPPKHLTIKTERLIKFLYATGNFDTYRLSKMYKISEANVNRILSETI